MKRLFCAITLIFLIGNFSWSQDIHLSQYKESPLLLNPALTGSGTGDWRAGINFREQWSNVAIPYNTFSVFYDKKIFLYSKVISVGGYLLYDQVNSQGLTKINFSPSFAYTVPYKKNTISVGVQTGIGTYKLDKLLTHPDQFNYETGTFDNTLYTDDNPEKFSRLFADFAIGLTFTRPVKNLTPKVGLAFYHINKPKISVYNTGFSSRMPVKSVFTANVPIKITSKLQAEPSILILRQRKSQEFIFGTEFKYNSRELSNTIDKLFAGVHYRNAKANGLASVVFMAGFEVYKARLALSYDEYFSSSQNTTMIGSTFEISVTYMGINTITDKFSIPCEIF